MNNTKTLANARDFAEAMVDYVAGALDLDEIIDGNGWVVGEHGDCMGSDIEEMHELDDDYSAKLLASALEIIEKYKITNK